jgi:glycosyltransferase involved in cell wall biosynthesis
LPPRSTAPTKSISAEINERAKAKFLGDARALLFPIDWPKPFGIVMIEAMACGTPVLAFRCGSVPEIIDNGVTGQIVDTEEEAIRKLPHVLSLDRRAVRRRFEQRFSATRMAKDYIQLYRSLMQRPLLLPEAIQRSEWCARP